MVMYEIAIILTYLILGFAYRSLIPPILLTFLFGVIIYAFPQ